MTHVHFEAEFWNRFDREARPAIESACRAHLRRVGCDSVDADDMISWAACRVWKIVQERPNALLDEDLSPAEAVTRVKNAAKLLARWAYLAHVRKGTRRASHERSSADLERVERLSAAQAALGDLERREEVESRLAEIRAGLNADLRARLAATWKDPTERTRIAAALEADRGEDEELMERVSDGSIRPNTIDKMRSRTLKRSRDVMSQLRRALCVAFALLTVSVLTAAPAFANDDDDGGEQTGGKSAHTVVVH